MKVKKIGALSLALLCFFLAAVPRALAHKLLVAAVAEADGALKVLAFFPDGSPAREVPVAVIPEDGRPALKARTDDQGGTKITNLGPGHYRVEVGDPLGHLAETRVVVAAPAAPAASRDAGALTPARLREPLPWGNILGGLGFIFGLAAFLMVLSLRRELKKHAPRD